MRLRSVPGERWIVLAGCAATLAFPGGAGGSTERDRCHVRGRTIAASSEARVYGVAVGRDRGERVYACLYATRFKRGVTRRLGIFNGGEAVSDFRLAGRFVAFERLVCQRGDCSGVVRIIDIRRNTVRRGDRFGPGVSSALALVATRRGATAWIRVNLGTGVREVRKLDTSGEVLLDAAGGNEIDPGSLAAGTSIVYWQHSEQVRSAPLR